MFIVDVPSSRSNRIDVQFEHDDVVFDTRHMGGQTGCKFRFSVKGRTLTITRIDKDEGWEYGFRLRAYLPTEVIPDFASTVYTYWGLRDERAPEVG